MRLGHVGYLEAAQLMAIIPVERPQVEHVLDVLHGVDVAVDVHIVIVGVDGAQQFGVGAHLHASALGNGALLVADNPVADGTTVYVVDVGGLPRFGVNHGPDTAAIAIDLVASNDTEVAVGEEAHGALHPRLHLEAGVLRRHLLHLDGQPREHPCAMNRVQIVHAEAAVGAVEIGSVEHVVAQVAHEEPSAEVAVEGLGHKVITSYFVHLRS